MAVRDIDIADRTRFGASRAIAASRVSVATHPMQVQSRRSWSGALFVLPYLVVYVVFCIYPLVNAIAFSTYRADLFGGGEFIGLQNFVRLFQDPIFLRSLWNTIYFILLTVPPLVVIGLLLALVLQKPTRTSSILRAVFFSSSVLSVAIVALLWRVILMPDDGLVAKILGAFGHAPIAFVDRADLALPALAISTIWWCLGLPMMLFLAALKQVPREIYDAAALDGAGRLRTLWSITLPSIRRTFSVVVIIEVVMQFQMFGQAQLLTQGGPNNASKSLVLFIYDASFKGWDVGYATAASQVLFGFMLMITLGQYLLLNRRREKRP